jgi:hypothetical protein
LIDLFLSSSKLRPVYGQKWEILPLKPVGAVQKTDITRHTPNILLWKEMVNPFFHRRIIRELFFIPRTGVFRPNTDIHKCFVFLNF